MRTFFKDTWLDLITLLRDREVLIIAALILLPWLLLFLRDRDLNSLQSLIWILGFIAFFWLIGHRHDLPPLQLRRPRLELVFALALAGLWILYRVGEYWHWYTVPTLGLGNSCGPISETPIPKMIEMFLVPVLFLLALKYSFKAMGFSFDKFSWLASLLPIIVLIIYGLINHPLKQFAISSACFFFGAGLPEEFLYRAFIQTRLEAVLRRPLWAVWLAAFVFGLSHVPIDLGGTFVHWQDALLTAFTYQMAVGFALGYAYMRTRNVLGLSIVHTFIDAAV
jgi:membrane protease YdiL (CAAX protease family)